MEASKKLGRCESRRRPSAEFLFIVSLQPRCSLRLLFLLSAVDLRLLQGVGVIDVDGLPLGVEIDRADAAFAMSIAGGLGAAEWQVNFCADRGGIDIGDARLQIADRRESFVHIF